MLGFSAATAAGHWSHISLSVEISCCPLGVATMALDAESSLRRPVTVSPTSGRTSTSGPAARAVSVSRDRRIVVTDGSARGPTETQSGPVWPTFYFTSMGAGGPEAWIPHNACNRQSSLVDAVLSQLLEI